jgi:hypothetical protein
MTRPPNIKRVGKCYVRIIKIDPYPADVSQKVLQSVILQVQKILFKLQGTPPASRL